MRTADWRLRALDILERIERIRTHVEGHSRGDLATTPMLVDALERNLEVIGEAVRYIPETRLTGRPEVLWADVRRMRNTLAHHYWAVDHDILWDTATGDMDALEAAMLAILEAEPEEPE